MKGKGKFKTRLRQIGSIVVSAAMALSCFSATAFADNGTTTSDDSSQPFYKADGQTLTLTSATSVSEGQMQLFQIFKGTLSDGKLTNVEWGESITNSAAFIKALKAEKLPLSGSENPLANDFKDVSTSATAQEVSNTFASVAKDAETHSAAFSEILFSAVASTGKDENSSLFGDYYQFNASRVTYQTTASDGTYKYVFNNLQEGYYLAAPFSYDYDGTFSESTHCYLTSSGSAQSGFLLQVVGPTQAELKISNAPTIDKKIVTGTDTNGSEQLSKYDEAAIGETVTFKVSSTVESMAGYTKYLFGLQDTMTSGLTFDSVDKVLVTYNNNTITLPVKTDSVTGDQWYSLSTTTNTNESTTLNFVFNKFIQYAGYGPVTVTVYYKAHLNEKAYVGASSNNINSVQAVYSNSPVWIPEGDNWNPDDPFHNQPVTTTTKKDAYVYTTSLKLQKRATGGVTPLSGAQFKIEGGSTYNAMFYVEEFVASGTEGSATRVDNKTYYKLTGDKGYTETAPTETTASSYALGEGKTYKNPDTYYLIQKVQTNSGEPANITCTTGPDGNIEINGLGAGEYTITEVSAPAGYSKLVNPIQVKIEFGEPESADKGCTWTYSKCTDGTKRGDKPNYQGCANPITIINEAGSSLPSTGGIGTTIFYVVGSILVLGACIALITRRRMSKSSK